MAAFEDKVKSAFAIGGQRPLRIVNQSGDTVADAADLFAASEGGHLPPLWRGVRALLDDEKFFWPRAREKEEENEVFWSFVDGRRGISL